MLNGVRRRWNDAEVTATETVRSAKQRMRIRGCLFVLLPMAFLVRVAVRMAFGEKDFWINGYTNYYELAQNVLAGKGFCFGTTCAEWPPLYLVFLTLTALGGKHYLLVVVPQALMGAGTALLAYLIGREIYTPVTGVIACGITAFYPYYVMHDTAIQESGMLTFCTALAVWLLLRAARVNRGVDWLGAGLALGSVALVRASPAPFIVLALIWVAWYCSRTKALIALLGVIVMVAPWLIRTWRVTGDPVFTSQTGSALWKGNNAKTFSHYPMESIDLSSAVALESLSARDNAELDRLPGEIQQSDWFARRAVEYMRAHPVATLWGAGRKIAAGFSWTLNPAREPLAEAAYRAGWIPVSVLGCAGILLAWPRRETILIVLMFVSFIGVTAIFWAHTSHRSYLDLYLMVFGASVVERYTAKKLPGTARLI